MGIIRNRLSSGLKNFVTMDTTNTLSFGLPAPTSSTPLPPLPSVSVKKLYGYDWYNSIGSPKRICAPMVDQSDLPFRLLAREYGMDVGYTPMVHSRVTVESPSYLQGVFSTCKGDGPVVAQFCANDPETLLVATRRVAPIVDAIDLNFGCPQNIAKRGMYGAFLMDHQDIVFSLIRSQAERSSLPILAKTRIYHDRLKTMEYVRQIEASGASALALHGRTRDNMKQAITNVDWGIIREVKASLKIPVFANGGIGCYEDVDVCLSMTGCDGVLVSEALLENPGLFSDNERVLRVRVDGDHETLRLTSAEIVQKWGGMQTSETSIADSSLFIRSLHPDFSWNSKITPSVFVLGTPKVRTNSIGLAKRYLELAEITKTPYGTVKSHIHKFLFSILSVFTEFREVVGRSHSYAECRSALESLEARYDSEIGKFLHLDFDGIFYENRTQATCSLVSGMPADAVVTREPVKVTHIISNPENCDPRILQSIVRKYYGIGGPLCAVHNSGNPIEGVSEPSSVYIHDLLNVDLSSGALSSLLTPFDYTKGGFEDETLRSVLGGKISNNVCIAFCQGFGTGDPATIKPFHPRLTPIIALHYLHWQVQRKLNPEIALSKPVFLVDPAAPGGWYIRHRAALAYGGAVCARPSVIHTLLGTPPWECSSRTLSKRELKKATKRTIECEENDNIDDRIVSENTRDEDIACIDCDLLKGKRIKQDL